MPREAKTLKSVIDDMTYGIDLKLVNLVRVETVNLTHMILNSYIDKPETDGISMLCCMIS